MDTKSKKMAITEAEMAKQREILGNTRSSREQVMAFKPTSEAGKQAQSKALNELDDKMNLASREIAALNERLEVETIDFLSGKDTDLEEPKSADTLHQAS